MSLLRSIENAIRPYNKAAYGPGNHPISDKLSQKIVLIPYIEQVLRYGEIETVERLYNVRETITISEELKLEIEKHYTAIQEKGDNYYTWRYYLYPDIKDEK